MADETAFLDLVQPTGGEAVEVRVLNENMDKIDAFAASVGDPDIRTRSFKGPAASINSIVPSPLLGDTYQETDGDKKLWRYDGTNWLTIEAGMYLIRPTTVVNATINPDGTVSPTASAADFTINGIFSPRFKQYKIRATLRAGSNHFSGLQLCAAGVPYAGNTYQSQRTVAVASGITTGAGTGTSAPLGNFISPIGVDADITINHPAHSKQKTYAASVTNVGPTAPHSDEYTVVTGVDANIYDGIKFLAQGGGLYTTATEIRIYGVL